MKTKDRIVVVGTDLGAHGDRAIAEGVSLLVSGSARVLHVVYAVDPQRFPGPPVGHPLLTQVENALASGPAEVRGRVLLATSMHDLPYRADSIVAHARVGLPVDVLLQACVDFDADLVILGTHGRQGLDRLLLGSVAEELLKKARCPVLIARRKDYLGLDKTPRPDAPYPAGQEPQREEPSEPWTHVSTTLESWEPAGGSPTGVRIV